MCLFDEFLKYLNKELSDWKDLEKYSINEYGRYEVLVETAFGVSLNFKRGGYYYFIIKFHYKNEFEEWFTPTFEELKINVLSEINKIKKYRKNLKSKLHTLNKEIEEVKKELGEY